MTDEIKIQQWFGSGMMINAYALDPWDERHPYNQAKAQGVRPEDFGIEHLLKMNSRNGQGTN